MSETPKNGNGHNGTNGGGSSLSNTIKLISVALAIAVPAIGGGFYLSVQMGQIGAQITELTHGQRTMIDWQREQSAKLSDHERRVSILEDRGNRASKE